MIPILHFRRSEKLAAWIRARKYLPQSQNEVMTPFFCVCGKNKHLSHMQNTEIESDKKRVDDQHEYKFAV